MHSDGYGSSGNMSAANMSGSLKKRPAPYPPPGTTSSTSNSHSYSSTTSPRSTNPTDDVPIYASSNPYARPEPIYASRRDSSSLDSHQQHVDGIGYYSQYGSVPVHSSSVNLRTTDSSTVLASAGSSLHNTSDPGGGGGHHTSTTSSQYGSSQQHKRSGSRGSISSVGHKRSPSSDSSNSVFFIPSGTSNACNTSIGPSHSMGTCMNAGTRSGGVINTSVKLSGTVIPTNVCAAPNYAVPVTNSGSSPHFSSYKSPSSSCLGGFPYGGTSTFTSAGSFSNFSSSHLPLRGAGNLSGGSPSSPSRSPSCSSSSTSSCCSTSSQRRCSVSRTLSRPQESSGLPKGLVHCIVFCLAPSRNSH